MRKLRFNVALPQPVVQSILSCTTQRYPTKKMTTHTNAAGTAYFSTTDENGQTVYSFSADFDDVWTQDDEDAINADSAPSKL